MSHLLWDQASALAAGKTMSPCDLSQRPLSQPFRTQGCDEPLIGACSCQSPCTGAAGLSKHCHHGHRQTTFYRLHRAHSSGSLYGLIAASAAACQLTWGERDVRPPSCFNALHARQLDKICSNACFPQGLHLESAQSPPATLQRSQCADALPMSWFGTHITMLCA